MATINQVYEILNNATKQAWGKDAITVINTSTLIAMGDYVINSATQASKDVFVQSMTDQIAKTIFVARDLRGGDLGISRDEFTYGAILRKLRVKPMLVENNDEYNFTNQNYTPFEVHKATVDEKLFSKFGTYSLTVTVTDDQVFTAFKNESEMMSFYSLIFKQLEDGIKRGEWAYDRMAICNFIAEKFNLQTTQPNKIHAINILKMFNEEIEPEVNLTVAKCDTDPDFLRFLSSKMTEFRKYLAADTDIFNGSDGYNSQTFDDNLKIYVLNSIDARLNAYLYSDTFHNELVKLDGYQTVNYWQGLGQGAAAFTPAETSKINITLASDGVTEINKSGIIALMMDKDAVATCYKRPKAESWRLPQIGNNHSKMITQMMINDLYENGIVFYVADDE